MTTIQGKRGKLPPELILRNVHIRDGEDDPATGDCIRVCLKDGAVSVADPIDSAVDGQASWQTDVITVTTTPKMIITSTAGITGRNSITIQNLSATTTIYVGNAMTVTADSVDGPDSTSGYEIFAQNEWNADLRLSAEVWAVVASGTAQIKVQEFAN